MTKDILACNFFGLFDLPVTYDVDLNKVQKRYMELQKQVHPDKYANGSDLEKRMSMQRTSRINEAQTTLKDDVLRATYLLNLKGTDINLENETTMDMDFLMHQLAMRERLENIEKESDPLSALDSMAKEIKALTAEMKQGFSKSYNADEIEQAREWIRKLQFMQKAKKEINTRTADLEDELMS